MATMQTLRRKCYDGPLIPQSVGGLVRFLVIASNIKGFRYGVHDFVSSSCIRTTEEGKRLEQEFAEKIGLEPRRLYTVAEAEAILERSKPFWFES